MPRFDDTPQWKREMRWDPISQKMVKPDRPPTRKQIDYHRGLCKWLGVEYDRPRSRREAQSAIDKLVNLKRKAAALDRKVGRVMTTPPLIRCSRCDKPAPVTEELTGPTFDPDDGTPNDPNLLVVLVPPAGWIGDPDSDGIVCGDCAEPEEIREWMADVAEAEYLLEHGEPEDGEA
ncbi:MAG: hypothetical protein WKF29_09905 [Thermoleophilaceae bacterium]